jgi:capsular exopolysaccharide synthesis family protein
MINKNSNIKTNTLWDYINLIKGNIVLIAIIMSIIFVITTIYAIVAPNKYTSTVSLKISPPSGNILASGYGDLQNFGGQGNDRFIANEIQTIYNSTIMNEVAGAMIDSFKVKKNEEDFSLIFEKNYFQTKSNSLKPIYEIAGELYSNVKITQVNNLDFIDIIVDSKTPQESALIANIFAKKYQNFNLLENRKQIRIIKEFLGEQLKEKQIALYAAEDAVREYQLREGGIQLDAQAQLLISKLADFESQKNTAKINMSISKEKLNQYKNELEKRDPSISNFLANKTSEPYLLKLQEEIASLQTQRDIALASSKTAGANSVAVAELNTKINSLKDKLNKSMKEYGNQILSSSPEEIKVLSQKTFEEEVTYQSLAESYNSYTNVINKYEQEFNKLPSSTLDYARLERRRLAEETLFNTLTAKYQEAQLNEQATPGNVLIMNIADPSIKPSGPNRILIILMGFAISIGFSLGFVYIKNYFDKTVKTPEDIEAINVNVLAWIPKFSSEDILGLKNPELIVAQKPNSIPSEAFRTIRTRLQFSHISRGAKIIMITSSAPGEGKTTVSANLAASFAQANKKTVIVDADLRKPRIHSVFTGDRDSEGSLDYLFGQTQYEKIINKSEVRNLDFITVGSIPSNPSEILGSPAFKSFVDKLRSDYEIIVFDAPPIMAVSDPEILARFVDVCLLVVSANTSEVDWVRESVDLLKQEHINFAGVLLNNFNYQSGYHSYYKYYDHYSDKYKDGTKKSILDKL